MADHSRSQTNHMNESARWGMPLSPIWGFLCLLCGNTDCIPAGQKEAKYKIQMAASFPVSCRSLLSGTFATAVITWHMRQGRVVRAICRMVVFNHLPVVYVLAVRFRLGTIHR